MIQTLMRLRFKVLVLQKQNNELGSFDNHKVLKYTNP